MLSDRQDAYGHLVYDYLKKGVGQEVVERDDGLLDPSEMLPAYYFAPYRSWSDRERRAMRFVKGRVLDVGCGAGRVALYLQRRGFDVLGIDLSPLAVRVCRLRGLKKVRVLPAAQIRQLDGKFDTILMFGNNFGLFGSYKRGRAMLKNFHEATSENARIIAESVDPYKTKDPAHLAYQRRNRAMGRMSGQVRIRVRYRTYMTPWFDYLLVSKSEMQRLIAGTGWRIEDFITSKGAAYIAIIGKAAT
jgi:cyclopropane fatty-acyl-phospholipid synthase-like methyltransferase